MKNMMLALLLAAPTLRAQDDLDPAATPIKAEVREAAIFKDGHAFVLAEAMVPARTGWYTTLDVPEAILGTLWTFSGHPKARVEAVRSGFEIAEHKGPCMTLLDTIESALGQEVILTLNDTATPRTLEGTVADLPKTAPERPTADAPAEFVRGETLHVKTATGIEVVRKANVVSIKFRKEFPLEKTRRVVRRRILVHVAVDADIAADRVPLRFVYVQKGLRWIPEYRAEILPNKKVRIALQATVVNEIADLRGITASLVVGIPNFLMKETLSPMALREAAAGLSSYFNPSNRFSNMVGNNAIMSQVARYTETRAGAEARGDASMDLLAKGSAADEYFLYSKPNVTLKRGERASYPIFEGTFAYEDVYTLKIGPQPPRSIAGDRSEELRQAMLSPKVLHGLKIRNEGTVPWTTGPAMIVRDGRALSQDLLRFTPAGGEAVLPMAELADVAVRVHDVEQNRTNNLRIDGDLYTQVFMKGTICLVNHRKEPLTVEMERSFFGKAERVLNGGTAEAFDFAQLPWDRYSGGSWPHWWLSVNGMFQASWKAVAEPAKPAEFTVEWSYYRR